MESLVRLCKDLCRQKLKDTEDFSQVEQYALKAMNSCMIDGLSQALAEFDQVLFEEREKGLYVKDYTSRTLITTMGPLQITRRRYVDTAAQDTVCLLDEICDLPERGRVSNGFSEMISSVAAASSVRAACGVYGFYTGVNVSPSTVFACKSRELDYAEPMRAAG